MRVVLYTKNSALDVTEPVAAKLRAEGHDVEMHNARYFDGRIIPCDLCICDWYAAKPADAYTAAGITVEYLRAPEVVETPPDIPAPLRTADAGVQVPTLARRRGRRKKVRS